MAFFGNSSQSTQQFVPVKEVRDSVAILEDGSFRAIIMVSTVNFALKSEDERRAILLQFQNLLNTLDFSLQIFVQSRELDIRPYLQLLEDQYKQQTNELLKIQTREYIEFIKEFTGSTNIMTKSFFAVIPYHAPVLSAKKSSSSLKGLFGGKNKGSNKEDESRRSFEEYRTQLEQRVAVVEQGLMRTGLRTVRLGSDELKELFYKMFNPGEVDAHIIH